MSEIFYCSGEVIWQILWHTQTWMLVKEIGFYTLNLAFAPGLLEAPFPSSILFNQFSISRKMICSWWKKYWLHVFMDNNSLDSLSLSARHNLLYSMLELNTPHNTRYFGLVSRDPPCPTQLAEDKAKPSQANVWASRSSYGSKIWFGKKLYQPSPEECHEDDEGAGAFSLWGQTKRVGVV